MKAFALPFATIGALLLVIASPLTGAAQDTDRAIRLVQSATQTQWVQLVPARANLNFAGAFTVEFWVRFEDWPTNNVALVSNGADSWSINLLSSGKIQFSTPGILTSSAGDSTLGSITALDRGVNHHVAVTWDPFLRRKSIYLNGLRDAVAENLYVSSTLPILLELPVCLGAQPQQGATLNEITAGSAYAGRLDEVRMWSTARSEQRIREMFSRKLLNVEPGLIANWSFDGSTLADVLIARPDSSYNAVFMGAAIAQTNLAPGVQLSEPATNQYSLWFDGIGDYVVVPDFASRTIRKTNATFEAWIRPSSLLGINDILSNANLTTRLKRNGGNANLLAEYLWGQFPPTSRSIVNNNANPASVRNGVIVAEFNRILLGPSLYSPARFAHLNLSTETSSLLQSNPTGPGVIRLNRLLLDEYFNDLQPLSSRVSTIFSKGDSGFGLGLDGDRQLRFHMGSPSAAAALNSSNRVEFDVWSHVAVVVSPVPGTANSTVTFFVNGVPVRTNAPVAIPTSFNNTAPLVLGRRSAQDGLYFRGDLDEVRIWDTARSESEVGLFANRDLLLPGTGLQAYWKFNEGAGLTLGDSAGANLIGLVTNRLAIPPSIQWLDGQPSAPQIEVANLVQDSSTAGLWIGQVALSFVNEVHARNLNDSSTLRATSENAAATIRILLHVDAQGKVRLLKDVTLLGTGSDPGDTNKATQVTLVTNPSLIGSLPGIVRRGGKMVGVRHGSAAFDFPGYELAMAGGVGRGKGCVARIVLPADHPTNPFRHRFHPEHRSGYEVIREIQIEFPDDLNTAGEGDAPGLGVERLDGTYEETVTGLHKQPIKAAGSITLHRITTVAVLNQTPPGQ